MNDNQITDDLLEELEELEHSAAEMDNQVTDTQSKKETLNNMDSPSSIDATSLALEAAKTAQDAASHSQKAAEASLSHASRQKEQIMELSDANFSWRQAVKSANKEINSAKSQFGIMLGVSIVTSITAMSLMGWMLYSMQEKEANFKGEILDILQTENALLTKQITIKVDELSALIELMTADMQKINKMSGTFKGTMAEQLTAAPSPSVDYTTKPETTSVTPQSESETIVDLASEVESTDSNSPDDSQTHDTAINNSPETPIEMHQDEATSKPIENTSASAISAKQYNELKALIEKILDEQHKLEAKTLAPTAAQSTANLSSAQEKQLKDIGWVSQKTV